MLRFHWLNMVKMPVFVKSLLLPLTVNDFAIFTLEAKRFSMLKTFLKPNKVIFGQNYSPDKLLSKQYLLFSRFKNVYFWCDMIMLLRSMYPFTCFSPKNFNLHLLICMHVIRVFMILFWRRSLVLVSTYLWNAINNAWRGGKLRVISFHGY